MRQSVVFILASTVLLAGVASAHVFAPLPDGTSFRGSAKAATVQPSASGQVASAKPSLVETRQAPVPLLVKEKPPVVLPTVETASATPTPTTAATALEGGSFAKGAIEADGYKFVKNIAPGPDGTWRARALRGKTEIVVTVDKEGRVSAD